MNKKVMVAAGLLVLAAVAILIVPTNHTIAIDGTITCLPHRDRTGPQTEECAMGLLGTSGNYYGLQNTKEEDFRNKIIYSGQGVRVHGMEVESPETQEFYVRYDIVGIIDVVSVKKLEP